MDVVRPMMFWTLLVLSTILTTGHGNYYGSVKVYHGGRWGYICGDNFDDADAEVICRMHGTSEPGNAVAYRDSPFPRVNYPIVINQLNCTGNETDIDDCGFSDSGACYHGNVAGVNCYEARRYPISARNVSVRLVNGGSYYGRVEVNVNGTWGTVCDDDFDVNDAKVICRMLGMYREDDDVTAYQSAHFGAGQGPIIMDNLYCNGTEENIGHCLFYGWYKHNCQHSEDAGVNCSDISNNVDVRLIHGDGTYGTVEVNVNGTWGTVCDDEFDRRDAKVICKMLGLYKGDSYTEAYSNARYGQGSGPITMDDLACTGAEDSLGDCHFNGWYQHNCGHQEDAGVDCTGYHTDTTSPYYYTASTRTTTYRTRGTTWPFTFYTSYYPRDTTTGYRTTTRANTVRLSGGTYHSGRVEIFHNGQWGTICDDSFDHNEVKVICRMLGLYQGSSYGVAYQSAHYGQGSGPIHMDEVSCGGYESDISRCSFNGWGNHDCSHSEDASLDCYSRYYGVTTESHRPWFQTTAQSQVMRVEDAINVSCSDFGWNVRVNMNKLRHMFPNAVATDIYMGENSCSGYETWNGYLHFTQGLRECLTSEVVRGESLVYTNQLIYAEHDPIHPFIIRHYNWTVGLECDVQRNETSSGHLHHDSLTQNHAEHNVNGSAHYAVNMTFFRDPNFSQQMVGNPLHVTVGSNVYVKVFTAISDWSVKMRVPSERAPSYQSYDLIRNGCEVDTNTHIISQSSHETKFVFQEFEFTSSHEGLYVFCDATFCSTSDYSRQCTQSCIPVIRRSAAGVSIHETDQDDPETTDGSANGYGTTREYPDTTESP